MLHSDVSIFLLLFYFLLASAPTEIYTLSLHDALPISERDPPQRSLTPPSRACSWCRWSTAARTSTPPSRSTPPPATSGARDRKSTRLNSSHLVISYAVFCLKKKKTKQHNALIYSDCDI